MVRAHPLSLSNLIVHGCPQAKAATEIPKSFFVLAKRKTESLNQNSKAKSALGRSTPAVPTPGEQEK